jgi:geranylgeranyl pyrophosphate synthase
MHRAHALVADQLQRVEETLLSLPDIQPPALRKAVENIVASGGKRFRPMITLLVAGMFGNLKERKVIEVASAIEMLHTATLVHDDLIDGSLVRRGASTLNAMWTPAATVLTGDYLFAYAAGLASRANNVRVMSIFSETLGIIVAGELRQAFTDWSLRHTREDYEQRIYAKTASMFVLAATAAGVLSGASENHIAALGEYGKQLGNAFQVVDDILDFTADAQQLGKPVGGDIRRGLITLPVICFLDTHPEDHDMQCALQGNCKPKEYDAIIAKIRSSDAIGLAHSEAKLIAHKAKCALEIFPDSPYRSALLDLCDYTVDRKL